MSSTIGTALKLTVFGESHGKLVGATLDGMPPGVRITMDGVHRLMDLRRPFAKIGTPRKEDDVPEITTGVVEGDGGVVTSGAPITILVPNADVDSSRYEQFRLIPRPGHADFTAWSRYGRWRDHRGGGMFSGRLTAAMVAAGAIARMALASKGVEVVGHTLSIGGVDAPEIDYSAFDAAGIQRLRGAVLESKVRCPDPGASARMEEAIVKAREELDSVGGIVGCAVFDLPPGLGEPFFDTVEGELAKFMFSIPAVKGVDFGAGFRAAGMRGSRHNDPFILRGGKVRTATNNAGGVLGGLTDGMPVVFRVAVKPTSSIARAQRSVNVETMEEVEISVRGRHDPCIASRAVAAVEAGASIAMLDLMLRAGAWAAKPGA
jgi:chorismate synthase